jgi:hypothetical protein
MRFSLAASNSRREPAVAVRAVAERALAFSGRVYSHCRHNLSADGRCNKCGTRCAGVLEARCRPLGSSPSTGESRPMEKKRA